MENESLHSCKACGEQVSKQAKQCPNCGQDQRGFFMRHKILTGIFIFVILGAIGSMFGGDNNKEEIATVPETDISTDNSQNTEVANVEENKDVDNSLPREHKAALKKAETYSNTMHMSKASIYDQLISEYGEGFPEDAAQYAIDNIEADWNYNALKKAETYAESMSMSDSAIYDQLVSEYGEKFTPEQAQYAVDNLK